MAVYDDEKTKQFEPSTLRDKEAGAVAARDQTQAAQRDSEVQALQNAYNAPSASDGNLPKNHPDRGDTDAVGKGYSDKNSGDTDDNNKPGKLTNLRGRFLNKKSGLISAGVLGIGGGGIIGFFSIIQGPAQIVQFSQLLQRLHLTSNENFGDDRSNKLLVYALLGATDKGRLGVVSNSFADKYTERLVKDTGMRPMFTEKTGRFAGYSFSDKNKALQTLTGVADQKKASEALERALGKGAELRTVNQINNTAGRQRVVSSGGTSINGNTLTLDFNGASPREKRVILRGVLKESGMGRISSAVAARLLIKRGGIDLSPLKNTTTRKALDKLGDAKTDREKKKAAIKAEQENFKKERAERIKNGVKSVLGIQARSDVDADGNPVESASDATTSQSTSETIEKARDSPFSIRSLAKTTSGPGVVAGVLCAAKSMGDDQLVYKQTNIVKPAMRLGMELVATGEQVRSNKNIDMAELQVISDSLYDEETNTSAFGAKSINSSLGKDANGTDIPQEASLKNVGDKSAFFENIDKIPGLGSACTAINFAGDLPIIKQIGQATQAIVNGAAGTVGINIDDLYQSALSAVSGNTINVASLKGGSLGAVADLGVLIGANDSSASMGGAPLPESAVNALRQENFIDSKRQQNNASFAQRYLDPYEDTSLAGNIVRDAPTNTTQTIASLTTPFSSIFSSLSSIFIPKTQAASDYDYGLPKIGFTLEEQTDPRFENPYENGVYIEQGKGGVSLNELSEKYEKCFSMKVVLYGEKVTIESGETVNFFTDDYKNLCDPQKNKDEMFLRYRFYLADTVNAKSLACYYDDVEACGELGISTGAGEQVAQDVVAGDANMKETIKVDTPGKFITMPGKYSCSGRTTKIDSRIAASLAYIITKYNMCADDGLANGHKSHGAGLGVDLRPRADENSKEEWKNTVEAAARSMGWTGDSADQPKGTQKGCAPAYSGYGNCVGGNGDIPKWVRWIGYNGDVDHGDPWHVFKESEGVPYAHIHIGWDTPNGDGAAPGIIGTPRESVYTFPAPIPDDLKGLL